MQVNMYDAKTRLSELVQKALAGEEVIIAKGGKPMVRLTPTTIPSGSPEKRDFFGCMKGEIWYDPEDIMEPLPDDIWEHNSDQPDPFL